MSNDYKVVPKDSGDREFMPLNSANPIVANALAWQRAINAKDSNGKELKVGDRIKVQIDMHGPWEGGGVVTALKPYRIVEFKDVFGHINTIQENSVLKV